MSCNAISEYVFNIESGGIWEEPAWQIRFNYHGDGDLLEKCRHCVLLSPGHPRWVEKDGPGQFLVPRIVVGINEGGFNSVGICLDCILEAVANLEKTE